MWRYVRMSQSTFIHPFFTLLAQLGLTHATRKLLLIVGLRPRVNHATPEMRTSSEMSASHMAILSH